MASQNDWQQNDNTALSWQYLIKKKKIGEFVFGCFKYCSAEQI